MKILKNSKGYTMAELLISLFITGLLATAGFQFYIQMHNSALSQEEVSEMQQSSRASLQEMGRVLRMAGYKLNGVHAAYRINGDSIYIFFSDTKPIDTILYFLADYGNGDLPMIADSIDDSRKPKMLMKQVNNTRPEVFADNINNMSFTVVNSSTIEIALVVQPLKSDQTYVGNGGFRSYSAAERIKLRNLGI